MTRTVFLASEDKAVILAALSILQHGLRTNAQVAFACDGQPLLEAAAKLRRVLGDTTGPIVFKPEHDSTSSMVNLRLAVVDIALCSEALEAFHQSSDDVLARARTRWIRSQLERAAERVARRTQVEVQSA